MEMSGGGTYTDRSFHENGKGTIDKETNVSIEEIPIGQGDIKNFNRNGRKKVYITEKLLKGRAEGGSCRTIE